MCFGQASCSTCTAVGYFATFLCLKRTRDLICFFRHSLIYLNFHFYMRNKLLNQVRKMLIVTGGVKDFL